MLPRQLLALVVLVGALLVAAAEKGEDGAFDQDLHLEEIETGGTLRLQSKGKLADIVNLDKISSVKRVLCKGSLILVALKPDEPDIKWSRGQIIVGSEGWGCGHNTLKTGASNIYAKIEKVKRPKKYVIEVHTAPAGPLDMFDDALIKVHYEQGKLAPSREKRYASNPFRKALNNINWNTSFTRDLPFNQDSNKEAERVVNVYKNTGKFYPSADTDVNTTYDDKDFLFTCKSCHGHGHISYYFELKIYKINNSAVIQNYHMQMELATHIYQNYSLYTDKEVTLTEWAELWQTPSTNIFETTLAYVEGFKSIKMSVNFTDQVSVFLTSATKDATVYDGDFTLDGITVISQSYDIGQPMHNDISSYNWTVSRNGQSLDTNATMNASYSLHQVVTVTPHIHWDLKDVEMALGPPIKVSIRPRVNIVSTSDTLSRCDRSSVSVDSNVSVAETDFKLNAYGIDIWNVKVMNSIAKKANLLDEELMKRCHADCHAPGDLTGNENDTMETMCGMPSGPIRRGDSRFDKLHQLWGDYILFASEAPQPSWCSTPGNPCPNCSLHTTADSLDNTCAKRVVNYDLAASLTRLAKLIEAEWPDRKLVVHQALDEPTSENPDGRYGNLSVFSEGRAAKVSITIPQTNPYPYTIENSPSILQRFEELGTCARFKYVKLDNSKASVCVEKVVTSSVKKRSLLTRKRRSGHVEHDMVESILQDLDTALREVKHEYTDPPPLASGESYPSGTTMEQVCGQSTGQISQDDVPRFKRLVEFPLNSVTFGPEGPEGSWCGVETRACRSCLSAAGDHEDTWSWCGTRTMNMRLAVRLQRLATLTDGKVRVIRALSHNTTDGSSNLYMEGRALTLLPEPLSAMSMEAFTSKAILAGFDHVSYSSLAFIEVCVKPQDGIQAHLVQLPLANLVAVALPLGEENEYDFPSELVHESRKALLFDVSTSSDTISQHFRLSHFQSPGKRYLRLDPILIDLLELAYDKLPGGFYVIPGSGYRPMSVNLDNIDTRHSNEKHRFQMGQAVEIKPNSVTTENKLFDLAIALIKAAKSVRSQRIGVGFGCKMDRLYFDIRPMAEEDSEPLEVWSSGSDSLYTRLKDVENMIALGGTVVTATADPIICKTPQLGQEHFYFNFDLDEDGYCWSDSAAEFCAKTHEHRFNQSAVLERRLVVAAGSKRLAPEVIREKIKACVIDTCGGCPSAGAVWKQKVIACTNMILTYLSSASVPFRPLKDNVAFFNTDNHNSAVEAQACRNNRVCVENTNIYALLMPLTTAIFQENNVDQLLFGGADNPTPLLEIVEQELAWRADGQVDVYIETPKDVNTLRNVIKILMMYNKNVTGITFRLDPDADEEDIGIALQRKVEGWSGSVCPGWSRIITTPYTVETIHHSVKKRSLELSKDRNKMALEMKNWELKWMLKS